MPTVSYISRSNDIVTHHEPHLVPNDYPGEQFNKVFLVYFVSRSTEVFDPMGPQWQQRAHKMTRMNFQFTCVHLFMSCGAFTLFFSVTRHMISTKIWTWQRWRKRGCESQSIINIKVILVCKLDSFGSFSRCIINYINDIALAHQQSKLTSTVLSYSTRLLFNQESHTETKDLFFKGDLAKTGSSINQKHITDRKTKLKNKQN